jgi:23S rRNA (guanine745-N1)-methyltransferase
MLACPVRGCGRPLRIYARAASCDHSHHFDQARSGYWNLLQPQDRRSAEPGDSRQAVKDRRSIHDAGHTAPLFDAISDFVHIQEAETVVDVGCGEGFYLGCLQQQKPCIALGIDISVPAVEAAAKRYPQATWIVANADRRLPLLDHSVDAILSITGRRNFEEFHRVLRPAGRVIVAVPGDQDLIELRGESPAPTNRIATEADPWFVPHATSQARHTAYLDAQAVLALRRAIYRPAMSATSMLVTFHLTLIDLRRS